MSGRLRTLLLGLLIAAAAFWWWAAPGVVEGPSGASVGQKKNPPELIIEAVSVDLQPGSQKAPVRVVVPNAGGPTALRSGLVIDVEGRPIPGVPVERRLKGAVLRGFETDSAGVFRFAEANPSDRFHVADASYTTLRPGELRNDRVRVIAVPTRMVTGVVLAKDTGLPIADARVTLDSGTEWVRGLESASGWSGFLRKEAQTDGVGQFEFVGVPDMRGGTIEIEKVGYFLHFPDQVGRGAQHLQLTMTPSESVRTVRGIVLDAGDQPVEGARIALFNHVGEDQTWLGKNIATSNATGEFEVTEKISQTMLTVVAKGLGVHRSEVEDPSSYLIIRMPGKPARIEGLVVDAQGEPVEGALIAIDDRSVLGNEKSTLSAAPMGLYNRVYVEDVLNGWDSHLRSDSNGRFSFLSAGPKSYAVRVIDKQTLASASGQVVLDRVNRFVLDSGEAVLTRGKVVDSEGVVVPGIHVAAAVVDLPTHAEQTESVITDDEGEFSFSLSPSVESVFLMVWGEDFPPMRHRIDPGTQNAVVTVARKCSVRLHWGAMKAWTMVSAHLADGEAVQITYLLENESFGTPQILVRGEVSAILTIPRNVAFWRLESSKEGKWEFKFVPGPTGTITDVHF